MIEITDTLRLQRLETHTGYTRWRLLEWMPGPTLDGHWRPTTKNCTAPEMLAMLERMDCPQALDAFRAVS